MRMSPAVAGIAESPSDRTISATGTRFYTAVGRWGSKGWIATAACRHGGTGRQAAVSFASRWDRVFTGGMGPVPVGPSPSTHPDVHRSTLPGSGTRLRG